MGEVRKKVIVYPFWVTNCQIIHTTMYPCEKQVEKTAFFWRQMAQTLLIYDGVEKNRIQVEKSCKGVNFYLTRKSGKDYKAELIA